MTKQEKTFNLLEATGLNWTVNKEKLFTTNGLETESYGVFRNDNNDWLGTVGKKYTPMQNWELAETIIEATEGIGLFTSKGGLLDGGCKVYLQAELPDEFIGRSGVKRHITALNSHDGTTSIGFGSSSTVVVCENTFFQAYKGLDKFRHFASASDNIKAAINDLRKALELDQMLMDNFKRMADMELKDEIVERVIKKIFSVDPSSQQNDYSKRKINQVNAFASALNKEIQLEGKTVWGLFNGVTRYTNHIAAPSTKEKKEDYLMSGGGYKISNTAYDTIMSWVLENSHKDYVLVS
jgi:phage/plasmid-like protein (TIGR03299 family)